MKKIIYSLALGCLMVVNPGCSGYMDDIEPRHAITQSALTESDMEKLLNGVYAKMEYYLYQLWWNDDIQGENFATGSGATPMLDPCNMNPSSVSTNTNVLSYWRNSYSVLYQVNFLLKKYEESLSKESAVMRKIGSACYYFRAFIYYRLAVHFGNVPIVDEVSDEIIPISKEAEVWQFVEQNITNALELSDTQSSKWYVSTDAIKALAARVSLFLGKNTEAANYADAVLKNSKYELVNTPLNFSSVFLPESSSKEIIFGYVNNTRTSSYCNFASVVNDTDGSWSYAPSPECYANLFMDDVSIKRINDIRQWATFHQTEANRIIKFSNGTHQLAVNNDYLHTPVVVSRIAEMYLIKAEALGKDAGASTLHAFLSKRYDETLSEDEIKALSDRDWQDLILDERRREFYAEGMRWQDIKRTKRYDLLETLDGRTYLMYYPIPQDEIDIAGKEAYPQNEGY